MKIMMFGHAGSLNRGCEAIVRSSSRIIKDSINNVSIELASGKFKTDKSIDNVDNIFDAAPKTLTPSFVEKLKMFLELKLNKTEEYAQTQIYKSIVDKIDDMDVCLSIGGDNYCYGEQQWLYSIDRNIKKKGKKLVLWACSIGD